MHATFLLFGRVGKDTADHFREEYIRALDNDLTDATVVINSGGGEVNAGIGIFNILSGSGLNITTVIYGETGSIAATIFLAGQKRISMPDSTFTLHAASYTSGARLGQIADSTSLISSPFRRILGWNDAQLARFFSSSTEAMLLPDEALSLGMITEVAQYRIGLNKPVIDLVTTNPTTK